ncbi:hypothetical protein BH23CHL7_BH23CHL7_08580 [soil metagenome]
MAIGVASRLYSSLLLLVAAEPPGNLPSLTPFRSPFVLWDGQWYLRIAQSGYHVEAIYPGPGGGQHDYAFPPGWPLLMRTVSLGGSLPFDLVAVILANLLFIAAAAATWYALAQRFDERTALWATALLAFSPASFVFSMAYSEPLFLLLAGLYFANRYGRLSPFLAAASILVRSSGAAVAASAALALFLARPPAPRRRLLLVLLAVGAAAAAWSVYLWQLTGNPFAWPSASTNWISYVGLRDIDRALEVTPERTLAWLGFVAVVVLGGLLLVRRHPDLAVYSLVATAMSIVAAPIGSMARHAAIAFPAFAALVYPLGTRTRLLLVGVSALAEIYFVRLMLLGASP